MTNTLLLLAGRVLLSILFLASGTGKFGSFAPALAGMLGEMGLPDPLMLARLAGLSEIVGGIAVAFGIQTRIVGMLLATWCGLTGVIVHGGAPVELMKNLALAGGLLVLAASSPGSLAPNATLPKRDRRMAIRPSVATLNG